MTPSGKNLYCKAYRLYLTKVVSFHLTPSNKHYFKDTFINTNLLFSFSYSEVIGKILIKFCFPPLDLISKDYNFTEKHFIIYYWITDYLCLFLNMYQMMVSRVTSNLVHTPQSFNFVRLLWR